MNKNHDILEYDLSPIIHLYFSHLIKLTIYLLTKYSFYTTDTVSF